MSKIDSIPNDYGILFRSIKKQIQDSRFQAYRSVNKELIQLYWNIGKEIASRQEKDGWGKSVVERLSCDLRTAFPSTFGFSTQNLWYMRQFYSEYNQHSNLQQLVGEIPWGQNLLILSKIKGVQAREYYLRMTAEMGWSRNVLLHQIKSNAHKRHSLTSRQNNFKDALPGALSEQADRAMKDVCALEFLGRTKPVVERDLEQQLINRIRDVLLEFGYGFAFIGNQYQVKLGEDTFFIDLLFYHRKLKCLVAIELKSGKFKPEHTGKMNFYLNLLNESVREPDENPSIGIILCGDRNRLVVEYALKEINQPMGVAGYSLTKHLPSELADKLPEPGDLGRQIMTGVGNR